jgi:osmotically-inducible protein OsmY
MRGCSAHWRVVPANPEGDGEIRDHVRDALMQEPAFRELTLRAWVKGHVETIKQPDLSSGAIEVRVEDGVVTLDGEVPSLSHKRLAGVLVWWVPGCRDAINGLGVEPAEEDNDHEIADGLRLALEKDPFVDAGQVHIAVHNSVVTLTGYVPTAGERDVAELDAWFIFGVDKVINHVEVAA